MADVGFSTRVQWRDEFGRFAQELNIGAKRSQREASEVGAVLVAGAGYAAAQEEGAAPHWIGWESEVLMGDEFGPVRGPVLHPGNPATHFMRDALRMVNQRIMGIIRSNMP
jgi:hypothetical protein